MSSIFCNTCQEVNNVAKCVQSLIIGTVSETEADIYVYITDARGNTIRRSSTTSVAGLITLDTSDVYFMDKMQYNISATIQTASNLDDTLMIIDNGSSATASCILFEVQTIKNESGLISYAEQTLTFRD